MSEPDPVLAALCLRAEAALQASDWAELARLDGELRSAVPAALRTARDGHRACLRRLVAVYREAGLRSRRGRRTAAGPDRMGTSRARAAYGARRVYS